MRKWIRSNRGFVAFMLGFGIFRLAVADWNPIPSESMRPSVLEGDVVFVDRLAYDLKVPLTDVVVLSTGKPKRGDVVVFSSPKDGTRLIKRIVGLPGDLVEMRDEVLFINGTAARYTEPESGQERVEPGVEVPALRVTETIEQRAHRMQILEGVQARNTFSPVRVPEAHYLMLGDNRDNSADSRYFGLVPRHRLIGRATRILVSADITGHWQPRWNRFGQSID
jgi:signal peptidase I